MTLQDISDCLSSHKPWPKGISNTELVVYDIATGRWARTPARTRIAITAYVKYKEHGLLYCSDTRTGLLGQTIVCSAAEATRLPDYIEKGTPVRFYGALLNTDDQTGLISLWNFGDCVFDYEFTAERTRISGLTEKLLREVCTPIELIPVKKPSLKERKEYGDILLEAAKNGDFSTIKEAVEEGALINVYNEYDHHNALCYVLINTKASNQEKIELATFLLKRGINPNTGTYSDALTMQGALRTESEELVKLLLRAKIKPDPATNHSHATDLVLKTGNPNQVKLAIMVLKIARLTGGKPLGTTEEVIAEYQRQIQLEATRTPAPNPTTGNVSEPTSATAKDQSLEQSFKDLGNSFKDLFRKPKKPAEQVPAKPAEMEPAGSDTAAQPAR